MRKILFVLSLMLILGKTNGQMSLVLQVPPSGVILKPQLWNAIILNSYPETKDVFVGLTLMDATTGLPVLTATSALLSVETGAVQVNESNLSPIQYDFLSPEITDRGPDGFLPAGIYTACYTISSSDKHDGSPVVEDCIPVAVEPVSPPIQNTPFDADIIQTNYPQFTWIPPAPMEIFSNLNYDFSLFEVLEGQTPSEAVQLNYPVYFQNQSDLYLNYPTSGSELDTGKIYAWKIIAKNNGSYTSESDIWTFKIGSDTVTKLPMGEQLPYVQLKKFLDATITDCEQTLKFSYSNEVESDNTITYSIITLNEEDLSTIVKTGELPVHFGMNYLSIPLSADKNLIDGRSYLLTVSNSKSEKWKMKFVYHINY